MKEKLEKIMWRVAQLLSEQSTWRGIAFIVGLYLGHDASGNWGDGAALGGLASAILKIILPDSITKTDPPTKEVPPK